MRLSIRCLPIVLVASLIVLSACAQHGEFGPALTPSGSASQSLRQIGPLSLERSTQLIRQLTHGGAH